MLDSGLGFGIQGSGMEVGRAGFELLMGLGLGFVGLGPRAQEVLLASARVWGFELRLSIVLEVSRLTMQKL